MKRKFSSIWRVAIATVMVISLGLVMAVPVMAGALTSVTATPTDSRAGATTTYTIAFTTATALSTTTVADRYEITFPAGFDASGAAVDATTVTTGGVDPTLVSATATVVTLDVAGSDTAGAQSIVLTGIVNTLTIGTTYTVTVETQDGDDTYATIDGPTASDPFAIDQSAVLTTPGAGIDSLTGVPTGSGTEAGVHSIVVTDATASTLTGGDAESNSSAGTMALGLDGTETLILTIGGTQITTAALTAATIDIALLTVVAADIQAKINAATSSPDVDVTVTVAGSNPVKYFLITVDDAGVSNSIVGNVTGTNGGETETGLGTNAGVAGADADAVDTLAPATGSNGLWQAHASYGNISTTMTITHTTAAGTASTLAGLEPLVETANAFIDGITLVASGSLSAGTAVVTVSAGAATKLAFTTQPAGSVSGIVLTTQPIVAAQDQLDNTDLTYTTNVVAATDDLGALTGTLTVAASSGVATFTNLVYTALADTETFQIDVTSGGLAGATSDDVVSDVVATKIKLTTVPGSIVSGVSMTQPIVEYVDAQDTTDTAITTDVITITENGAGSLAGTTTATAALGVATFSGLVYTAVADGESVTLTFTDDAAGTVDFSGVAVDSGALTANVIATKLVIVTQPDGAVSGVNLVLQPLIHAVDLNGTLDTGWTTNATVANESGVGAVTGASVMSSGVALFTDVRVTETPVTYGSYTLRFASSTLTDVVSDSFKVYDKILDLKDDTWTLVSTDDYILSSGGDTSAFIGTVPLKYVYTGSSYVTATVANITPVEALYVKTTASDGLVGLNYSAGSPGASIKALVAGWNLISSATSTTNNAVAVLSPMRYVQVGEQQGVGLTTLVSQNSYNVNTGDFYIPTLIEANWTGAPLTTTTLDAFDGYWVYMNGAKSFGVIPQ